MPRKIRKPDEQAPEKPETQGVKEVRDDLSKFKAIQAVVDQEGGQILLGTLKEDICSGVEAVIALIKAPEIELRTSVAKLQANLNLYRVLKRSKDNVKLAEEELSKLLELED